jgi:inorganic triphosphatase YgiF
LALAEQILRARPDCEAGGQIELRNIYFDTPDFILNRQRMALRVRQKGSRFIQTLKTQGEFIDGGHRRMEWEWPLATAELDLSLLAATPLSGQADLNQLQSWVVAVLALCAKSSLNSSLATQQYCGSWRWNSPRWYPFF